MIPRNKAPENRAGGGCGGAPGCGLALLVGSEKLLPVSHSYDKNRLARIKLNTVDSPVVDDDEEVGRLHTEIS